MKFIIFVLIMILSFPCYGEPGTNHKQVVQEITQGLEEGKKHDWASALKHFEKATVLDPKSSWAWWHIQLASATDGNLFASKVLSIISYQKFINLYFQRCYHILKS